MEALGISNLPEGGTEMRCLLSTITQDRPIILTSWNSRTC